MKLEEKINRIIVANLMVYTVCRLPELTLMVAIYFFDLRDTIFEGQCSVLKICYLLSDSIQYLYMISYITNIYFYYRFNSNFEKSLRKLLNLKPLKYSY